MSIDPAWLASQFPQLRSIMLLGRGGQKFVYSATHPSLGDIVLKIIHPSGDPERTTREILAVENVKCPRVPNILEQGQVSTQLGNCIWLFEERVIGSSLRDCLMSGALPPEKYLRLGLHMLEALLKAEEVKIVHRDIKPENIMLDSHEHFWLLDFGLARHLDMSSLTNTVDGGVGTLGYSPPEQMKSIKTDIDSRSDLFALGVTLHECATGIHPFRNGARDALDVFRRTESMALPPLNVTFNGGPSFKDLVSAMTQKRVVHRPPSVKVAYTWMKGVCDQNSIS